MYEFFKCLSGMGPAKSNWASSFGSFSVVSCEVVDFGMTGFRFLPILMQGVQFCVRVTISLCILGNHMRFARCIIPDLPGWLRWIEFIISFRSWAEMKGFPS